MITINLYHTDSEELIGTVAPVMPIDFDTFLIPFTIPLPSSTSRMNLKKWEMTTTLTILLRTIMSIAR